MSNVLKPVSEYMAKIGKKGGGKTGPTKARWSKRK